MRFFLSFLLVCLLAACGKGPQQAQGSGVVLLVMGDSLSAGYRINEPNKNGWVALTEQRMRSDGFLASGQIIVNASVSGETTQGGLQRLPALLTEHRPNHVVIELGANDFLRRQSMAQTETNLRAMIEAARAQGATVALLAVEMPGLAGFAGGGKLEDVYERIGDEMGLEVIEYPLSDLFNQSGMMLEDRLHPSQMAQPLLAEEIDPEFRMLLVQ